MVRNRSPIPKQDLREKWFNITFILHNISALARLTGNAYCSIVGWMLAGFDVDAESVAGETTADVDSDVVVDGDFVEFVTSVKCNTLNCFLAASRSFASLWCLVGLVSLGFE